MLTAEPIMASHKANIETLFGLTHKAFEGVEKLVELNLQASKAALAESANQAQAVMGAKDAQELLALQAGMLQPLAEKTAAYSRHLYDIASQNAPAGSETAVAVMKSAVAAANNAFEAMQKAVKQASDMAEANFNSVAATAVNASKTVAKKR